MQISARRPYARGVDQLMYVGDDGATAPQDLTLVTTPQMIGVGIAFALAPKGKRVRYAGWATAGAFLWNLVTGKLAV